MKIGYVFTELPSIAGAFPNAELEEMAARGADIDIFILRRRGTENEETRRLAAIFPVHSSPYVLSASLLRDFVATALRHPLAVAGVFLETIRDTMFAPRILVKSLAVLPKSVHFGVLARRRGIDLLHAYWASLPALSAGVMSRFSGIPFTTWAHAGSDIYNRKHQTDRALRHRLLRARRVFTCNRANLEHFATLCGPEVLRKTVLQTHGVDLGRFQPATRSGGTESTILAVGRLSRAKGFHVLLKACALLREERQRFRCRIVGPGRPEDVLPRSALPEELLGVVEFLGPIEHSALPRLYQEAQIFVVPSVIGPRGSRDGLPNVLLEAMASGLPCIGSDVASIPEAIEDGVTGLLVPPENPPALARAILQIWKDAGLRDRLGKAAAERARERYGRGPAMDRLYAALSEIATSS